MAVTKKIVSPPTFLTYSLGCRTNQAEISVISKQLTVNSFVPFDKTKHLFPTFIMINTCAVTQKAERESKKTIRHFKRLYPKAKIVVLGCGVDAKQKLKINFPEANLLISNKEKSNSLNLILHNLSSVNTMIQFMVITEDEHLTNSYSNSYTQSGRTLLKIQEGCNQFCNYCIVPYLRGKPKSTSPEEIICQINKLVSEGIKEIILCGINLSLYGKDSKIDSSPLAQNDKMEPRHPERSEGSCFGLIDLLKKILKETKVERISFSSIEPEYLYQNREFTKLFIKKPRLSKYLHLAFQSGSKETIKKMGRKTDLKKLLKILHFIKQKCSVFAFRADIIVGFPGESEKDFQETLDFIKKAPISFTHVFPFSIRPGTLAEKMIKSKKWKDLPTTTKKQRAAQVMELAKKIQKKETQKLIGRNLPCLIIRKLSGGYETIANNSWPIIVRSQKSLSSKKIIGKILPVRITDYKNNQLLGEIVSFPTN